MSECQKKCHCGEEGTEQSRWVIADANDAANDSKCGGKRQEEIGSLPVQGSGESFKRCSLLTDMAASRGEFTPA